MRKTSFKFKRLKSKTKSFVFIVMFLIISVGYGLISSNLSIVGLIKVAARMETGVTINNAHTSVKNDLGLEINSITLPANGSKKIKITPDTGYYVKSIECDDSNIIVSGITIGYDTYNENEIEATIENKYSGGNFVTCTFTSSRITAEEVIYTNTDYPEISNVKQALDKLYEIYEI